MVSKTFELVLQAADELLQEGRRPTQQSIRDRIGQGSVTTINKALNQWWSELGGRIDGRRRLPELPEPVESAVKDIWQLAVTHAQHGLDLQRKDAQSSLSRERALLEDERGRQQEVITESQQKLERAFDRIEDLQTLVETLRQEKHRTEQQNLEHERARLVSDRELRTLAVENEKLAATLQDALEKNETITAKNKELSADIKIKREFAFDQGDSPVEAENRNLRTALAQADARYVDLSEQLALTSDELLETKRRCFRLESGGN